MTPSCCNTYLAWEGDLQRKSGRSPCLLIYEGIQVQLIGGNSPNEVLPSVSSNGLSWSHRDMMDYTITVI